MDCFRRFLKFIRYWYFQWEIASMLYVMDPEEKVIFHFAVMSLLIFITYSIFSFVSGHLPAVLEMFNTGTTDLLQQGYTGSVVT